MSSTASAPEAASDASLPKHFDNSGNAAQDSSHLAERVHSGHAVSPVDYRNAFEDFDSGILHQSLNAQRFYMFRSSGFDWEIDVCTKVSQFVARCLFGENQMEMIQIWQGYRTRIPIAGTDGDRQTEPVYILYARNLEQPSDPLNTCLGQELRNRVGRHARDYRRLVVPAVDQYAYTYLQDSACRNYEAFFFLTRQQESLVYSDQQLDNFSAKMKETFSQLQDLDGEEATAVDLFSYSERIKLCRTIITAIPSSRIIWPHHPQAMTRAKFTDRVKSFVTISDFVASLVELQPPSPDGILPEGWFERVSQHCDTKPVQVFFDFAKAHIESKGQTRDKNGNLTIRGNKKGRMSGMIAILKGWYKKADSQSSANEDQDTGSIDQCFLEAEGVHSTKTPFSFHELCEAWDLYVKFGHVEVPS